MDADTRSYPSRPLVGIGVVLFRDHSVLLIRRARAPALGQWSFPGGGQHLGETAEGAARRELLEETGLHAGPLRLVAHVDSIHHDPEGRVLFHYTILDFCGHWIGGTAVAGDDASDIAWAPFDALGDFDLWSEAFRVIELARRGPEPGR